MKLQAWVFTLGLVGFSALSNAAVSGRGPASLDWGSSQAPEASVVGEIPTHRLVGPGVLCGKNKDKVLDATSSGVETNQKGAVGAKVVAHSGG